MKHFRMICLFLTALTCACSETSNDKANGTPEVTTTVEEFIGSADDPIDRVERFTDTTGDNIRVKLPETLDDKFIRNIHRYPVQSQRSFERAFIDIAKDDVVYVNDIQRVAIERANEARTKMTSILLKMDTDKDGVISPVEILNAPPHQLSSLRAMAPDIPIGRVDRNEDGNITRPEILQFSKEYSRFYDPDPRKFSYNEYQMKMTDFDTDENGEITFDELIVGVSAIRESATGVYKQFEKPIKVCETSRPNDGDVVVFISGEGVGPLSSVSVGTLVDVTQVVSLNIEPGSDPLYIVAAHNVPAIWNIEGMTGRVARFVTAGPKKLDAGSAVGVVGLPENKIEFLEGGCLDTYRDPEGEVGRLAKLKWSRIINRSADHIISKHALMSYRIKSMNVPSNIPTKSMASESNNGFPVTGLDRYSGTYSLTTDELTQIDSKKVISPTKVEPYDVYPEEAGLVQLINSGHLQLLESSVMSKNFKIVKPIPHFPPGLNAAIPTKFILAKGVPYPSGDPERSSVYSEETGECLSENCKR